MYASSGLFVCCVQSSVTGLNHIGNSLVCCKIQGNVYCQLCCCSNLSIGKLYRQDPGEQLQPQLQPLPISAVAVGKAPPRGDSTPTGSDILLDALHEEEVAAQAQQFLGSEQGQAAFRDAK